MKNFWVLVGVCCAVQLFNYNVQAHPHRSIEDTEEDSSSDSTESDHDMPPVVPPVHTAHDREPSQVREMTSHEKSHEKDSNEEDINASMSESQQHSDEDDTVVKFPKTESLCPARPEEITNIEVECAREYQQWKEQKAKKEMTTTLEPPAAVMVEVDHKSSSTNSSEETMSEDMKMSTEESTVDDMSTTTTEMTMTTTTEEDMTTTTETEMTTEMATTPMSTRKPTTTTMMPIKRTANSSGRKHKRSVKRKRSCYPATCILKKLKLLDSMGQLNSKQVQKFAVNMTVDDSTNLEQKAVACVKEINDAMIDSSADIGKKVGCVAQKVITCLNKGLACPIVKIQH